MSIFELFKKRRREEPEEQEQPEQPKNTGAIPTPNEKSATVKSSKPPEKLIQYIWETREQYPSDMKLAEMFLPSLRERLQTYEIKRKAAQILAEKADGEDLIDEKGKPFEIKPTDAKCLIYTPADKMTAFVCVLPPIADGAEISSQNILDTLEQNRITYGVDQDMVLSIASEKTYSVLFPIARGMPSINGEDGAITDHFSRQEDVGLKEDAHGNVDHKSLRRFHSVHVGDLICEITPPTEGQDGIDVTGKTLKAKSGKAPLIPQGKNTALTEDGSQLLATMDGDLSFHNGAFHVERLLTIQESVDNAVGNLDYNGDIVIQGDVKSGFKVCATGDIIVRGMVEGATLHAGGNIEIAKGMNGNGQGLLEADGDVKITFMEHSTIVCGQNVYASTVINSNITCGESLFVKEGKGIIIGGSISAGKSVEAKRIGNQSGCENSIKLGQSMLDENNLDFLRKELKENTDTLDKMQKNISFLTAKPQLSSDKQRLLEKLQIQSVLYVEKIDDIAAKLEELENTRPDFSQCRVRSEMIYPTTKISLDYAKFTVRDASTMCMIYYQDGELVMGTF